MTILTRRFLSSKISRKHFKLLIVGGGTGGMTVAIKMRGQFKPNEMAIIEPSSPLWSLVGAGMRTIKNSLRKTQTLIPKNTIWIQGRVTDIKPDANYVILEDKSEITYDYLVVSTGLDLNYDKIDGALSALTNDPRVCSNYSSIYVGKTFPAYQNFTKGQTAVFTHPATPIKCSGAPLKKKNMKTMDSNISFYTPFKELFSVKKYSDSLAKICADRSINTHFQQNLIAVDYEKSEAVFESITTKEKNAVKYDFLHIVPPMSPPKFISKSALADPKSGFLSVCKHRLFNEKYPNVFSLGDCSSLPVSKTAAGVASQSEVLITNLCNAMKGKSGDNVIYEGYTSCPILTSYSKGIIAEYDYSNTPKETFAFNQAEERKIFAFIKKTVLPSLYWDLMMKGLWSGPAGMKKFMNPFDK